MACQNLGSRLQPQYARTLQSNFLKNEPQLNKAPRPPHQTAQNPAGMFQGSKKITISTKIPIKVLEFP